MRTILNCFFILFVFNIGLAQSSSDSVSYFLNLREHDTLRCSKLSAYYDRVEDDKISERICSALLFITQNGLKKSKNQEVIRAFYMYQATAFINKGYIEHQRGEIEKAVKHYLEGIRFFEKANHLTGMAISYNNIGSLFRAQKQEQKALEYFQSALITFRKLNDSVNIASSLQNIATVHLEHNEFAEAERMLMESKRIYEHVNDPMAKANLYSNIGALYNFKYAFYNTKNHPKDSLDLYLRKMNEYILACIQIQKKGNFKRGLAMTYKNYASNLNILGKNDEALSYLDKSYKISTEIGFVRGLKAAALLYSRIYKLKNNFKDAVKFMKIYVQMRDSLSNQENRTVSMKEQMQYEYEKKSATDSIKNAELDKIIESKKSAQQAKIENNRVIRFALFIGLALSVLFFVLFFNRLRLIRKQKKLIELQKKEMDEAYNLLEEKNKEVLDSIHYASRIQRALITDEKQIHKLLRLSRK